MWNWNAKQITNKKVYSHQEQNEYSSVYIKTIALAKYVKWTKTESAIWLGALIKS